MYRFPLYVMYHATFCTGRKCTVYCCVLRLKADAADPQGLPSTTPPTARAFDDYGAMLMQVHPLHPVRCSFCIACSTLNFSTGQSLLNTHYSNLSTPVSSLITLTSALLPCRSSLPTSFLVDCRPSGTATMPRCPLWPGTPTSSLIPLRVTTILYSVAPSLTLPTNFLPHRVQAERYRADATVPPVASSSDETFILVGAQQFINGYIKWAISNYSLVLPAIPYSQGLEVKRITM